MDLWEGGMFESGNCERECEKVDETELLNKIADIIKILLNQEGLYNKKPICPQKTRNQGLQRVIPKKK